MSSFNVCTIDIEVAAPQFPYPEQAAYPINLISLHSSKLDKIFTFGTLPYTGNSPSVQNYHYCADEKMMIERFIDFFRKQRFDIITGWNSRLFDMYYIIRRCENLKIEKSLSPVGIYLEKSKTAGYHIQGGGYSIGGLSILDGQDLYRNFEREKKESYALDAIGQAEIGEGKIGFEGQINDLWQRDWNLFVEYNVQDVVLTKKINDKKRYIELAINICYTSLVPFEKIFSSINLVTGYISRYLYDKNIAIPDRKTPPQEELPGAFVMAKEGPYKYCMNLDVESMYPFLIMLHNISPETLVLNPENTDGLIKSAVEGVYYRSDKIGVLPQIVRDIFNTRKRNKNKYNICERVDKGWSEDKIKKELKMSKNIYDELVDEIKTENGNAKLYDSQQYIYKILANSVFGDISNRFFIFYNIHNAKSITLGGQKLIKFLGNAINEYFNKNINSIISKCFPEKRYSSIELEKDVLILTDTDSCYLCFEEIIKKQKIVFANNEEFRNWCMAINDKFLEGFINRILRIYFDNHNIKESVNFRKEKIITKMLILAKKKYAMEVIDKEGIYFEKPKLEITGIETVRTDTPKFCRSRIKNVIKEIFKSENRDAVIAKLRSIKEEFMKQDIAEISTPKGIKDYDKYGKSVDHYLQNGLSYPSKCPIQHRASINYNYIIEKYKLPLVPITNGTKMKLAYVSPNKNVIHEDVIGFIGKWPDAFNEMFYVDKEAQWIRGFQGVIDRFFVVLNWGKINLESNALDSFIEFE
jgi:DNA polymerase elongation subunit (family B)